MISRLSSAVRFAAIPARPATRAPLSTCWGAVGSRHASTSRPPQDTTFPAQSQATTAPVAIPAATPSTAATTGVVDGTRKFNPAMFNVLTPQQPQLPDVLPLSGTVGAEVRGVDLSRPMNTETKERILEAYFRYGAVFFRNQNLTHAQHLAVAAEFGEPEPHPIVAGIDGFPEIVRIIKDANTPTKFGETWHSDHSFMEEPCVGSVLVARELPPYGNDTLWASMYAVYDSLSDGLKAMLNGMTAVHSAAHAFNPEGGDRSDNYDGKKEMKYELHPILTKDVEHPVVLTHPVTGRKALYVNDMFTVRFKGMTEKESRPLLNYLFSVTARPEFQCRFQWSPGSVAFWDNRATQHMAVGDEARFRRVMERITLKGCAPQ